MTVTRKNAAGAAPDVPLANLRIASPALATWTSSTNGVQVPNAGFAGFNAEWARWFPTNPPARSGAKHPLAVSNLRISLSVVTEA